MAFDAHVNFAYATVATAPSPAASGTSLTLSAGAGAGFPVVPFNATVWPAGSPALATNAEIVRVTARTGDVLTIARAAEPPSAARAIVVGDQVAATITAKTLTDAEGPVADARLSANVALLSAANVFTGPQTIQSSSLRFNDTGAPADQRLFNVSDISGVLRFQAYTDALATLATPLTLSRNGDVAIGGTLTGGIVPDARLSSNVALKNIDNSFVVQTLASGTRIQGAASILYLYDPTGPAGGKVWRLVHYGDGLLRVEGLTDDFTAVQATALTLDRSGNASVSANLYEKGRATPLGHWLDVPYAAGNFTATGSMTWSVPSGTVSANRYTVIGKTLTWAVLISAASLGGSTDGGLYIIGPPGFTVARQLYLPGMIHLGGSWVPALIIVASTYAVVYRLDGGLMALGTMSLAFEVTVEVA